MTDILLALDFGGTKLSAALYTPTLTIHPTWKDIRRVYSRPGADAAYDQATMLGLAHEMLSTYGQPSAVGVSFGGPVDYERGLVRLSHHVPGWEDTPLAQQLEEIFQVPVRVDNDANVAALGEARYGAGLGLACLMYLTISTGVGGGLILDRQLGAGPVEWPARSAIRRSIPKAPFACAASAAASSATPPDLTWPRMPAS